jgi:hypothetical protein
MEKIQVIYDGCDKSLSLIIKTLKDAIVNLSKEKPDIKQYHQVSMAFVDLVKSWQECVGLSKLILKSYEFYVESESEKLMSDIQGFMNQYQKCKARIFIIIGSLKDTADIESQLNDYMERCDALPQVGKLMVNIVNEMDLLEEEESKESQNSWDSDSDAPKSKKPEKSEKQVKTEKSNSTNSNKKDDAVEDTDSDLNISDEISEKDLLGDDILQDAKEGGINDINDITILSGDERVVVGDKYQFGTRDLMMRIKHSSTREEQLECAGFKSEEELDEFVKQLDISKYVNKLIKEYNLNELYTKSLQSLLERVNTYCSRIGNSNESIVKRFKKVIKSINDCLNSTFQIPEIDESLYHINKCYCASQFENDKFATQIKLLNSLKPVLKELSTVLGKKQTIPDLPTYDQEIFTKIPLISKDADDNLRELCQLRRRLLKPMERLEVYFGHLSEYIDGLWLVYNNETLSQECAKYRIYLLNKNDKWSKSDKTILAKCIEKYQIGDYGTMKKFVELTV